MDWFVVLLTIAIVLYIVYWYIKTSDNSNNKKIRILKCIIFCIATISLGGSAIIKLKRSLPENDTANITLETIIIVFCIIALGIGITGLKKSITDNHDSQKWVFFYNKKRCIIKKSHTKKHQLLILNF